MYKRETVLRRERRIKEKARVARLELVIERRVAQGGQPTRCGGNPHRQVAWHSACCAATTLRIGVAKQKILTGRVFLVKQ